MFNAHLCWKEREHSPGSSSNWNNLWWEARSSPGSGTTGPAPSLLSSTANVPAHSPQRAPFPHPSRRASGGVSSQAPLLLASLGSNPLGGSVSGSTLPVGRLRLRVAVPRQSPPQLLGPSQLAPHVQVSCEGLWGGRHWRRHVQDKHLRICNGRGEEAGEEAGGGG